MEFLGKQSQIFENQTGLEHSQTRPGMRRLTSCCCSRSRPVRAAPVLRPCRAVEIHQELVPCACFMVGTHHLLLLTSLWQMFVLLFQKGALCGGGLGLLTSSPAARLLGSWRAVFYKFANLPRRIIPLLMPSHFLFHFFN